jgi:tetratricopeptide (TPR) repeat protein
MTTQAAQPPHLVFSELRQWWQIHEGFGLSYVFSDDAPSMVWLRERIGESLRFESIPLSLSILDSFDTLQSFLQALQSSAPALQDPCSRQLVWIAPAVAQSLAAIKRLNEMRQLLLHSPHLYLVCLPSSIALDAARLASDLWSVRSLVLTAQGQHWRAQRSLTWARELGDTSPATSSASTPTIEAWNHYHGQWLAQADSSKRSRVSVQLGLQAMADALALRQFQQAYSIGIQTLGHAEQEQDDLGRANVLRSLGDLERRLGQVDSARTRYTQALALYEQEQNDLGRANVLNSLGDLERRLGQVDSARTRYTQALVLYEQEQDDLGRANVLNSLGNLKRR